METRIDEITSGVYRLSIFVSETAPPAGLTYNHFLIAGDEPLLFHCGKRRMFPLVSAGVARIMPVERLRWLAFGHFEADEFGSMNERGGAFSSVAETTFVSGVALLMVVLVGLILVFFRPWPKAQSRL